MAVVTVTADPDRLDRLTDALGQHFNIRSHGSRSTA
jgi:hypothetical protein